MTDAALRLLDVVDKAQNGPACKVKDFDLKVLPGKIRELKKEFRIKYDPDQPVPNDNSLADALYEAGLQLFLDVGILCLDTERRIIFTEEEVKQVLRNHPGRLNVGEGKDARTMYKREIHDKKPPIIFGGPIGGTMTPGKPFIDAMTSMAQETLIDMMIYGSITSIEGRPIVMGSPLEIHAAKCEAMWMREAAARAGKPGMHLVGTFAESAAAEIAASDPNLGYRPSDARNTCLLTHLKINYNQLNKVKHFLDYGTFVYGYHNELIGGYAGGADGTAIACIASAIGNILVNIVIYHTMSAPHIHNICNTGRESIWAQHLTAQALARNTNLINYYAVIADAGPCTDMMLHEMAVAGLMPVSGSHLIGIMGYGSRLPDRSTGLEQRFMGEVGLASVNLNLDEVNEITKKLLLKYEAKLGKPPAGKPFQECYDPEKLQPTKEWQQIYETVKKEVSNLGIPLD